MKSKTKSIVLVVFSLLFLQISTFAQQKQVDEEINSLEKRLAQLKEQKLQIEQKEQEIRDYEEKIKRMKAEVDALKSTPTNSLSTPTSSNSPTMPQNNETPQNNPQLVPQSLLSNNTPRNPLTESNCITLDNAETLVKVICDIANKAVDNGKKITGRVNSLRSNLAFAIATKLTPAVNAEAEATKNAEKKSLLYASEKKRTDKQVGSTPSSSGTTSLVVKGGAPAIIGWAIENGSATSSINGNTVTIRVNPYNFGRAVFLKQSLFDIKSYAENVPTKNDYVDLKKLSFGFSFDTTRGTDTPTFIVSKQQLASWSVRYEFINHRNPLSSYNEAKRNALFAAQAEDVQNMATSLRGLFDNSAFRTPVDAWITSTDAKLAEIEGDCIPSAESPDKKQICVESAYVIIKAQMENLPVTELAKNTNVVSNFTVFNSSAESFQTKRQAFLDEVNKETVVTFEYTNNREVNAPDTSNFRFIWEKGIYNSVDFTLNAELTMFNKKPIGMGIKRIKDFNIAFQFDAPLKDVLTFGNSILSGSFKYTRQQGNVVLPNGVVADGTKGDILFGQAKLTIPFGDTGIKLPFSVTFGNRSEFVKEKFARGNFGLTFDLDQIFRPLSIFR